MRASVVVLVALVVGACGGGSSGVEIEVAAATFIVSAPADQVEIVGRDRLAVGAGDEDRLDVLRLPESAEIIVVYPSSSVPEPFEFLRNPLLAGGVIPVLESADQIVAVVYPLLDMTPGGRFLSGVLIAIGPDGTVVGTDWDNNGDAAVAELVAWGAERGIDAPGALRLAVAGLTGDDSPDARTAADFLR
jgi:hypothetical protein